MKLLIEDFPYPAEKVRGLLGGESPYENDGKCRIKNVGYFYNPSINDCVFILPKVILDYNNEDEKCTVFNKFKPEDIIDVDQAFRNEQLSPKQKDFIYNLSTWIYRAIAEFVRINEALPEKQRSRIVYKKHFSNVSLNGKNTDGTLIDIILSLIKFANENREFFMFIIKNIHRGYNKINWSKTIATKTAFVHEGTPHYLELVNKKKQVNFDEELLIIFYSILNYIREKFGFPINLQFNYELISGAKFDSYLAGLGKARLLQIKYKYFSDKALQMWNLCYCFFAMSEQMAAKSGEAEYLFVSDFDRVFETMIDSLVSDSTIPNSLKNQRDGKIVDHIYPYESLISPIDIYHLGDSKYYKIGASVHGTAFHKQYTYARNVIHYNLDLFRRLGKEAFNNGGLPYLDTLTDGYNVTPNFFLSAEIDHEYKYEEPGIHVHKAVDGKNYANSKHFANRLFDRDTLWLTHYDINFLYVLALFVSPHQTVRDEFKEDIRKRFREHFIGLLNGMYEFYKFKIPTEEMGNFVTHNFRELTGKIFHFKDNDDKEILIMALGQAKDEKDESMYIYEKYKDKLEKFMLS
ncbi:MAG: LlaJI family restriction endonuclease [Muribaculaceae bacterium]|nr:LlaJI family restriction endonuclease [Muribaculaceae bacterium]